MPASKKFINDPANTVNEMIQGVLLSTPGLKKVKSHNVLVRSDIESHRKNKVTLISGGGSGHEPAHAGFIGSGLLSAAVLGGMFASPSVAAILAAIRTCTEKGAPGCLLIVKNYTGDRLNFGAALEAARGEGLNVKMVVVADDCAQERAKGITGRRGVAGTVFVHKVAGAAAEGGASLDHVYAAANEVIMSIGTLGVALTTCTLPGQEVSDRLSGNKIEIGLGIHGEPGMKQLEAIPADAMVDAMIDAITSKTNNYLELCVGDKVAVLINNLGGTPTMELYICARRAVERIEEMGVSVTRIFIGPFMTSLEMQGVSCTIMKLSDLSASRLDASTTAPAWLPAAPRDSSWSTEIADPVHESVEENLGNVAISADVSKAILAGIGKTIDDIEPKLTEYDRITGDGDCGITMKRGATALVQGAEDKTLPLDNAPALFVKAADILSASMGGTSGILFEIGLRAAAAACIDESVSWHRSAFAAFVEAVKFYGGADRGYRTMLDALLPALDEMQAQPADVSAKSLWTALATQAQAGADSTATMTALAGRSNWVPEESLKGTPDPGAVAVAAILKVLADSL